ncbi:MAG: hypothetical protein WCK67_11760 [bacterium]
MNIGIKNISFGRLPTKELGVLSANIAEQPEFIGGSPERRSDWMKHIVEATEGDQFMLQQINFNEDAKSVAIKTIFTLDNYEDGHKALKYLTKLLIKRSDNQKDKSNELKQVFSKLD